MSCTTRNKGPRRRHQPTAGGVASRSISAGRLVRAALGTREHTHTQRSYTHTDHTHTNTHTDHTLTQITQTHTQVTRTQTHTRITHRHTHKHRSHTHTQITCCGYALRKTTPLTENTENPSRRCQLRVKLTSHFEDYLEKSNATHRGGRRPVRRSQVGTCGYRDINSHAPTAG